MFPIFGLTNKNGEPMLIGLSGKAGSGKTLIMLYRAKLMAKLHPNWNVLFIFQ